MSEGNHSSHSEALSTEVDGNKSVEYHRPWPGGCAYLLCRFTGTATICLELSTPDLGGWVQCGAPVVTDGLYSLDIPPGVLVRITITGFASAAGHIDLFEG